MYSCWGIDFSLCCCSPWSTRIICSSSLSLYPREAALYFHECIKDLNEIHTTILISHFSVQAGRCSSVPVRATTGFRIVLEKCKSLITWCCHLMSRRKKGALHGVSYFPPLIRSSSNTQFRIFPTSIYFISTINTFIQLMSFLSYIKIVSVQFSVSCQLLQLMLLIVVANDGLCGLLCQTVPSLADCPMSHLYCSMHLMTTMA